MKAFDTARRIFSVGVTQIKHYKPEICFFGGSFLVVAGLVKGYSAGKKLESEKASEQFKKRLDDIDAQNTGVGPESKKLRGKEKRKATREFVADNARTFIEPIVWTAAGITVQWMGFRDLKKTEKVLMASVASLAAANQALEANVSENYGPEALDISKTGGHIEPIETTKVTEDGEVVTKKEQLLVLDSGELINPALGDAFVYSKETVMSNYDFIDNEDEVKSKVSAAVSWANRKIKDIDGYVFNEDIVEMFGIEPRPQDKTNGKVFDYDDPMHNNGYSIGIREIRIKGEDGTLSRGWVLVPNSDPIIDIYQSFSLHKLLK